LDPEDLRWYGSRNYALFGVLTGTVCVATPDGITRAPRGAPVDMSDAVRVDPLWDHAPSWLLVSEILAFDWRRVVEVSGTIPLRPGDAAMPQCDPESYAEWRGHPRRRPRSFDSALRRGATLSEQEADRALEGGTAADPADPAAPCLVRVSWSETRLERDGTEDFLAFVEEFLVPLDPDPSLVRIVFGFDS
jgi:hypothetical protein